MTTQGSKFIADVYERITSSHQHLMRTTIDIDEALMRKAMRLSSLTTKKAVVEAALRLLIQTHSQVGMRRLRGKGEWEGNLNKSRRGPA
jgi:Arc/MetJ family transcription regulator